MKNDSIKKYLIPNIPYLFILWAFLKLGTAYRLAAGADFAHKLMGLGQTIGPAFADFAPGLAPFDWLVGIVGAVAFRVMVYVKSKNAKKFRRDEEYGSARWGCPKDIAPFVDPKFENNIILTGTEFLTMNTRPKNPVLAYPADFAGQCRQKRRMQLCVCRSQRRRSRAGGPLPAKAWVSDQGVQFH